MIRNYLLVLTRYFVGNKLYSCLNILGLGISLAVCLTIGLFVRHELSYDTHFANANRIYRIGHTMANFADSRPTNSSGLVADTFQDHFDLIQNITRIIYSRQLILESDRLRRIENQVAYADEHFLEIFDFEWVLGTPATALTVPDSIVMTESLAREYFGDDYQLQQTIDINQGSQLTLTGVIKDLPVTTHFEFNALMPVQFNELNGGNDVPNPKSWGNVVFRTYALVAGDVVVPFLEEDIARYANSRLGELSGQIVFELKKLTDIHLDNDYDSGGLINNNLSRVRIFSAIAFSILLIAIINFMNMSTARASTRVIEVGLRSTLGGSRRELVRQFLGEAIVMTALSMILALALTELLVPLVNGLLGTTLKLQLINPGVLLGLLVLIVIIGLLAGSYPAWYMTSLKPVDALRGSGFKGNSGNMLRSALVILQFSISIALIISSITIYRQMEYARTRDTGFSAEQMLVVTLPDAQALDLNYRWHVVKQALLEHPGIASVTHSVSSPLPEVTLRTLITPEGSEQGVPINALNMEVGFLRQYQIPLLAGSYFVQTENGLSAAASNRQKILLNETAVKMMGWTINEAIGKPFDVQIPLIESVGPYEVIGVVADTTHSARNAVIPLIYVTPSDVTYSYLRGRANIKLTGTDVQGALQHIDTLWAERFPQEVIQRTFLDERIQSQYRSELLQSRLLTAAASFAILISCVGLLGLTISNTERRIKEIGVRKVMGSDVWQLIMLVTHEYSKPVLIANVFAWPLAWYAMNNWLKSFADHTGVSWWVFGLSSVVALLIAWLTVGSITAKAAQTRPVEALRYE